MGRFLAGVAAALLLVASGFFHLAGAGRGTILPPAPASGVATAAVADLAGPPAATERTREEKRFARYDRDKNSMVAREEYLIARRKAFAKLDTDGDGRLGFEEYAIKTTVKFAAADKGRNGALNSTEFATTRVVRKSAPRCACPPAQRGPIVPPSMSPVAEEGSDE